MEDFVGVSRFPRAFLFHRHRHRHRHPPHPLYRAQHFFYGLYRRPLTRVSSCSFHSDAPLRLPDPRYLLLRPPLHHKRRWKKALPLRVSRKKSRKVQSKKDQHHEREKEVLMLRKLWETGCKVEKIKKGHRKRKTRNRQKQQQAEIQVSSTLVSTADAKAVPFWKESSTSGFDHHSASWEEQKAQEGESVEVDWGELNMCYLETQDMVEAEKEKWRMLNVQRAVLDAVVEFLGAESDIEDSDDEEDFDELECISADGEAVTKVESSIQVAQYSKGREDKAFDFFANLFSENDELRKTYEECCNQGCFECFVCAGGGGSKLPKKFSDLVGLVQHTRKVLNTNRRPEHRGYGKAVCALLGWYSLRGSIICKALAAQPRCCIPPPNKEEVADDKVGAKDNSLDTEGTEVVKLVEGILYDQTAVCKESYLSKDQENETFSCTAEGRKNGAVDTGLSICYDNDGFFYDDIKDAISVRPIYMQADADGAGGLQDTL